MVAWLCCLGLLEHATAGTCGTVKHPSPRTARERGKRGFGPTVSFQGHVPKGLLTSYWTSLLQALTNFPQYPKGDSD